MSNTRLRTLLKSYKHGRIVIADLLAAVLEARLFVIAAQQTADGDLYFAMDRRPDIGPYVSLYTEQADAKRAAQSGYRVIGMRGTRLMSACSGTAVVINPADEGVAFPQGILGLQFEAEDKPDPADVTHARSIKSIVLRDMLDSIVLVPVSHLHGSSLKLRAGSVIHLITTVLQDGTEFIPFYSSTKTFYEAEPNGCTCAQMSVRELFEGRPDMHFCANPGSPHSMLISPERAKSLLESGTVDPLH